MSSKLSFEAIDKGDLSIQLRSIDDIRFRVITTVLDTRGREETTEEVFEDFDSARLHQAHLARVSMEAGWVANFDLRQLSRSSQ